MSGTLRSGFRGVWTFAILSLTLFSPAVSLPQSRSVATPASETILALDPLQTKVHWILDSTLHTVHGTFALKSGAIHFDPETGDASGEIIVLATSGESGNDSRDARMHKEILETAKYPEAIFRPTQIDGKAATSGASDVKLRGTFSIHGGEHELTATVHAVLTGSRWTGTAKFDVPYVKWGIKDPSNFLLKVKPVVEVEIDMSGDVTAAH